MDPLELMWKPPQSSLDTRLRTSASGSLRILPVLGTPASVN